MSLYTPSLWSARRGLARDAAYICSLCSRRLYSREIVKENDIVMLKHRTNSSPPVITEKLKPGKRVALDRDYVLHEDIIGKAVREVVGSRKRVLYRIHEPTLAEYTDNSPRIVTPIYSQDASLIVSLLDLHPTPPGAKSANEERLDIFEAGTGHGALTLHLARAIHAANTAPPELPEIAPEKESLDGGFRRLKLDEDESSTKSLQGGIGQQDGKLLTYNVWRSNRRAIIHTLDSSDRHSAHAEKVVRNFRKGLYYPHVDFHIGSIEGYLSARLVEAHQQAFLQHAILDLPATQDYLEILARALKPNGSLIIFCPSVTQIIKCIEEVKEKKLPLFMEKTIEVGGAIGVGGREWDVRPVKPRALLKSEGLEKSLEAGVDTADVEGWEMICRPKVGVRIAGGGFIGQFRKIIDFPSRDTPNTELDSVT